MKVSFACPSCDAAGSVDAAFAGRSVRCKQCGARFTIPAPDQAGDDVYALDEPAEAAPPPPREMEEEPGTTFVSTRGDESYERETARPPKPKTARPKRKRRTEFPWAKWLLYAGAATVVALALVALIMPRGTVIVGSVLIGLGMVLVLAGYGAGAFGAFSEDFVYGMLYLLVPFYSGYYLLTRWDDLWVWFTCATAGVGLIYVGTELLRWGGVAA